MQRLPSRLSSFRRESVVIVAANSPDIVELGESLTPSAKNRPKPVGHKLDSYARANQLMMEAGHVVFANTTPIVDATVETLHYAFAGQGSSQPLSNLIIVESRPQRYETEFGEGALSLTRLLRLAGEAGIEGHLWAYIPGCVCVCIATLGDWLFFCDALRRAGLGACEVENCVLGPDIVVFGTYKDVKLAERVWWKAQASPESVDFTGRAFLMILFPTLSGSICLYMLQTQD
ncbi:hypothetical protein B0I35DRAFT_475578 [Stachybotrys elegans]|uniref:Uncharacterized protein n=1 Tax=Stachybotrys elegans TaxID=80388 RepID=A0A8K0T1B5_9HYPO|nr:hypothetical protein B0I35DRAFT_475578 [Stachybotrys elegans]